MKEVALVPTLRKALDVVDPFAYFEEPCPGVYVFDAFTPRFCRDLLKGLSRYESMAPNSMNKYGLVLKAVGCTWLCDYLLNRIVNPLTKRFYPEVGRLRKTHGFVVNYDPKKQGSLDLHEDSSAVTLNVCLGREFTGGKLLFWDEVGKLRARVEHKVGQAVLHRGGQLHEAQRIRSGTRSNLILWCSQ